MNKRYLFIIRFLGGTLYFNGNIVDNKYLFLSSINFVTFDSKKSKQTMAHIAKNKVIIPIFD